MPAEKRDAVAKDVRAEADRERGYLLKAREQFLKTLPTLEKPGEKAVILYLIAETSRRAGDAKTAADYYAKVLAVEGGPEWLPSLAKEQAALLGTSSPAPAPAEK